MAVGGIFCILDPRYRMSKKLKRQGKTESEEA
jgi:cytochrome c-type biogenesis protein CcmF